MNYITLENISKSYGEKVLFDRISLKVNEGDKIALVAKNGSGKSTLLRIIAGEEKPEGMDAHVWVKDNIRLAYLHQEPEFPEGVHVLEALMDTDTPAMRAVRAYEEAMARGVSDDRMQKVLQQMELHRAWDMEARVQGLLDRFNLLNQPVSELSGGQRKRLALARLLLQEPEVIILDEPTNHLDLHMIEWLEDYLKHPGITVFMVTHDRYFLERVCNQILELDRGELYKYSGNYSDFLEKKTLREENEAVRLDKNTKLFKKELDWIRRQPKARGTKAKARVDKFDDIQDRISGKRQVDELQIDIKNRRIGSKILEAHNVSKSFGPIKIVEHFNYKFKKGEQIGIAGPNGVGKSSFVDILTGRVRPDTGKIVVGGTITFGYYKQEGLQLKEDKTVLETITDIAEYIPLEKGKKLGAEQLLERFLFPRPQQQVYVSQLSGGEKRRLYLLTILMQHPNFLILDEPTNDLDVLTLNILEDFLEQFPGCLLVISHDRYFMDKLVDHLFVFEGEGKVKDFNGTYSEYREKLKREEEEARQVEEASQKKKKQQPNAEKISAQEERARKKAIKRIERQIMNIEEKKKSIGAALNDPDLTAEEIAELSREYQALNESMQEKENEWEELVDGS